MFSKASKGGDKKGGATQPAPPSIIGTDLTIVGDLTSDGEIQIDGSIEGDVRSKVLLVGETAHVKGQITADTVRVHGTVTGQIKATTVNLSNTAHVVGDVLHQNLSIENGAFLEGHCRRLAEGAGLDARINLVLNKDAASKPRPPVEESSGATPGATKEAPPAGIGDGKAASGS